MLFYISLGTLFNEHPEFYRHCFAAFANSMYQVVLSVGHKTPLSSLGDIPPKFIVQNYVPQLEILQRANVFISHGGMNSVSEALYYGVPLLVIPQSADQPWVAKRVAQLGAGKLLPRTRATPGTLQRITGEILTNPSYAQASVHIGETLRQAGGYQCAADEIQLFILNTSHNTPPASTSRGEVLLQKLASL